MKLTIGIPTYNRREKLKNTLNRLMLQTCQDFLVAIHDNCSEYDIEELVREYPEEFRKRIRIHKNQVNTLVDFNFATIFSHCESGWLWTISDDDEISLSAVALIKKYISNYPDSGILDVSLENYEMNFGESKSFKNLEAFADFYYQQMISGKNSTGALIYLSNKIYNIDVIKPAVQYVFKYNYSHISSAILIARTIELELPYVYINEQSIVSHNHEDEVSWKLFDVAMGMITVGDIPFSINVKAQKKLRRLFLFPYKMVLVYILLRPQYGYGELKRLYEGGYRDVLSTIEKVEYMFVSNMIRWGATRKILLRVYTWNRKRKNISVEDGWK